MPVFVTVTDAAGRLAPDLAKDDFEILDEGKRQEITVFAHDPQPISVVLLLDRSRSMVLNFRLERDAAEQFVTDLWDADKARIGSFSERVEIDPLDFTNDRRTLLEILDNNLQDAGPTPLWNAVDAGITALLPQQGRRVVFVFTDGADAPGNTYGRNASLKDVMTRARREDVMVYAVGLTGQVPVMTVRPGPTVFPPGPGGIGGRGGRGGIGGRGGRGRGGRGRGISMQAASSGVDPQGGWGGPGGQGGWGRPGGRSLGTAEVSPDKGLTKIAAESGGGYFELDSPDNLAPTFARVAEELHHQYALGFTPAVLDGKSHRLEVRVKREGMAARARTSYVAAR